MEEKLAQGFRDISLLGCGIMAVYAFNHERFRTYNQNFLLKNINSF